MSHVTNKRSDLNGATLSTFPLLLLGELARAFPVYSSHQRHQVIVIDLEVSAALRARLPQVGVQKLSPVVQILLWRLEIELEKQARRKEHNFLNPLALWCIVDASVYLERVASVVWCGLVSEGLA